MPSKNSLVDKLISDFPQFTFKKSETCHWSPKEKIIYFSPKNDSDLLHELGHALLNHSEFNQDIELLHIERDAWEKARGIALNYNVKIEDDDIEDALDGYRDWLHARSTCPNCQQIGVQSVKTGEYSCLNCESHWTVNDARTCGLRRRTVKQ